MPGGWAGRAAAGPSPGSRAAAGAPVGARAVQCGPRAPGAAPPPRGAATRPRAGSAGLARRPGPGTLADRMGRPAFQQAVLAGATTLRQNRRGTGLARLRRRTRRWPARCAGQGREPPAAPPSDLHGGRCTGSFPGLRPCRSSCPPPPWGPGLAPGPFSVCAGPGAGAASFRGAPLACAAAVRAGNRPRLPGGCRRLRDGCGPRSARLGPRAGAQGIQSTMPRAGLASRQRAKCAHPRTPSRSTAW